MASFTEIITNKKYKLFSELGYSPDGTRIRKTKVVYASGVREARRLLIEFEQEIRNSLHLDDNNPSFEQFVDQWRVNYARSEYEPTTEEKSETMLKTIIPFFKTKKIKDIKTFHIVQYFTNEKSNNRGSLEDKYKVLKSLFKHAVLWQVIDETSNPMDGVEKPKNTKKKVQFYTTDEITRLFKLIESSPIQHQLIIKLAIIGGMRRGEILGIADDVLDFKNNRIHIKRSLQQTKKGLRLKSTKTEEERTITLSEKLMTPLEEYYNKQVALKEDMGNLWQGFKDINNTDVFLLFSNEYGKAYRPDTVSQFWGRFTQKHKNKIKRIRFHDLRHSSASFLLSKGANMKVIQNRLGHKDIKVTMNTYSHLTDEDDEQASNLFDDLF